MIGYAHRQVYIFPGVKQELRGTSLGSDFGLDSSEKAGRLLIAEKQQRRCLEEDQSREHKCFAEWCGRKELK